MARLVRAARAFENPGLSVASVSDRMDYSSPQSFGRHVRMLIGLTALEFRERYNGEGMLLRFRDELVRPHLVTLRTFDPLASRALVPPGAQQEQANSSDGYGETGPSRATMS